MREQAFRYVDKLGQQRWPDCVCVYESSWHQGVVGLVATRIREQINRPVVAFAPGDGGLLKGSGRSIPGIHLRDLLATIDAQQPELID